MTAGQAVVCNQGSLKGARGTVHAVKAGDLVDVVNCVDAEGKPVAGVKVGEGAAAVEVVQFNAYKLSPAA